MILQDNFLKIKSKMPASPPFFCNTLCHLDAEPLGKKS